MKNTVPLSIPNKKINYSPQYRNMVEGENIVFGQEGNRVETINTDVIELLKVKTPEVSMKDYVITAVCATEGAEIFYTSDGSEPTKENGTIYNYPLNPGSFPVTPGMTIKAITVCYGKDISDVSTFTVE